MIRVGEKVCCELVGVPYRAFFEIAFDRMPVDISPILFYDISVEAPDEHIESECFECRFPRAAGLD